MAKKDIKFTLDTIDSRYSPVGTVKQLDSVFFYIKITENGVTKDLTGQTIRLFAIKEDKKIVEQTTKINITNQSEGLVEIELLNAAIQVHGFTYFELEISDSNGIISTADFILRVNKRVGSDEAIESTNEVSTLKEIEVYVAQAKQEIKEFKKLQGEMLKTNESINAQESLRVEAEKKREEKINEFDLRVVDIENSISEYRNIEIGQVTYGFYTSNGEFRPTNSEYETYYCECKEGDRFKVNGAVDNQFTQLITFLNDDVFISLLGKGTADTPKQTYTDYEFTVPKGINKFAILTLTSLKFKVKIKKITKIDINSLKEEVNFLNSDGNITYEKINQTAINSLRTKNLIPKIFKWNGNILIANREGFVADFNAVKYRWIKKGLNVTLDKPWSLAYLDARDGHELIFHKVDDWKTLDLDFFTNPNVEVVAYRSGNNKTCYYIEESKFYTTLNEDFDFVNGYDLKITSDLQIEVSEGQINDVINNEKTILSFKRLYDTQKFNYPVTLEKNFYTIHSNYNLDAKYIKNLKVEDNETKEILEKDIDYATITDNLGVTKIKNLLENDRLVNLKFEAPMCRIDTILIDKHTGEVTIKEGINSNNNPTIGLWEIPDDKFRLAYVLIGWEENKIYEKNIFLTKNINAKGQTIIETIEDKNYSKKSGNKLFKFYSKIESVLGTQPYRRTKPIRIGIIGDSTCQNNQKELVLEKDNLPYGWTNFLCDMLHESYPNAKITMYRCWSDNTPVEVRKYEKVDDNKLEIEIYNYAQGGHTLYQFMFDEHNHFKDNDINHVSPCFIKGKENYHDLIFLCRTNWMLEDEFLKDLSVREILKSNPYNIKLHEVEEYSDLGVLMEDNSRVYKGLLRYISSLFKEQGADLVYVSSTPDSALNFGTWAENEASSAMMSALTYEISEEFNSLFINLFPIFTKSVEKNGLPLEIMYLPQQRVHPGVYMHKRIADEVFKIFNKDTF
ncbi:hypothetical protein QYB52_000129 [Clostridium perfringens]|nr:hypothetical protein [Clostridium perfringens]